MKSEEKDIGEKKDVRDQQPRKSYTTPQLTVHGTVDKITRALAGAGKDAVMGSGIL